MAIPSVYKMSIHTEDEFTDEKYKKIKRKLKETMELNDTLSKGYIRAKKKIRTLTFERNLLLDNIARRDNTEYSSDELMNVISASDSNSETEAPSVKLLSNKIPRRIMPDIKAQKTQPSIEPIPITQRTTTVASAPPKRSKASHIVLKTRRVQPIERDADGNPKLPQQIGVLTVLSLGKIRSDIDAFHNERYIFPVGYTVRRTYPSMIDPHNNTVITSTIIDGGDGPRFHVVAADQPDMPIVANSATGAWTVVVRKSNEIRHRDHSNSASGPDYYGFKHPTIAKMIQDLPGTRLLKNYVWQTFEEMEPKAAKGVMAAAEKKRDNLEQMGNANRRVPMEEDDVYDKKEIKMNGEDIEMRHVTPISYDHPYSSSTFMIRDSDEEIIDELGSDNEQ